MKKGQKWIVIEERKGNNNKRQQRKNKFATQTYVYYTNENALRIIKRKKEEMKNTHTHTLHQEAQTVTEL